MEVTVFTYTWFCNSSPFCKLKIVYRMMFLFLVFNFFHFLLSYLTCCFSHTSKLSGHFCGLLIQNFAFSETTDTINSNRKLLWWQKNQYYFDVKQRDMVQFFQIISSLVCLVLYSLPNTGKSHIYKSNCLAWPTIDLFICFSRWFSI